MCYVKFSHASHGICIKNLAGGEQLISKEWRRQAYTYQCLQFPLLIEAVCKKPLAIVYIESFLSPLIEATLCTESGHTCTSVWDNELGQLCIYTKGHAMLDIQGVFNHQDVTHLSPLTSHCR